MLTTMPRRTPILAIILAPVVLYILVQFWDDAFVPVYRAVRYSDTLLMWRFGSDEPAMRIGAAKDAGSWPVKDAAFIAELVVHLAIDESVEVRKAAATSLGQIGSQRPLTAEAIQALSTLVLNEQDEGLLSAVMGGVGQSAAENRYRDDVVERIAGIVSEKHLAWQYSNATRVLGQIGAAQPLPEGVFAMLTNRFVDS